MVGSTVENAMTTLSFADSASAMYAACVGDAGGNEVAELILGPPEQRPQPGGALPERLRRFSCAAPNLGDVESGAWK
jgi:hypothetical protein